MKSLAVRPSIGLPFLSFTVTVSTTSCVLVENLTRRRRAAGGGCCCAAEPAAAAGQQQNELRRRSLIRIVRTSPAELACTRAHRVGRRRQAELRAARRWCSSSAIGHVIERVGGVEAQVGIDPVADAEGARHARRSG